MKTIFSNCITLIICLFCTRSNLCARQQQQNYSNDTLTEHTPFFDLKFNDRGLASLKKPQDIYPTDYLRSDATWGEFEVKYKTTDDKRWKTINSKDILILNRHDQKKHVFNYVSNNLRSDVKLSSSFTINNDELLFKFTIVNQSVREIQLGSLSIPINYNALSGENPRKIFEESVIKHHFISGNGSYIFWERPTGVAPYLLMMPLKGTQLEYDDMVKKDSDKVFTVYIHSKEAPQNVAGTWRLPQTTGSIKPKDSVTYGFKFKWANSYQDIKKTLYNSGIPDIDILPGMTIPSDLFALISIKNQEKINSIIAEYPSQTTVTYAGIAAGGQHLHKIKFDHLGENRLTIHYGKGLTTYLEFFSTEPLSTLYQKRAAFLVNGQQHKVPDKWYDGVFSEWDMRTGVLRGPDNTDGFDGWWGYVLTCDDPGLCKAPFLAAKNVHYPDQKQIDALEYYIKNFVWGKLQRTDHEHPYPYGVYGTPNWYVDRDPEKRKKITNQNLDKEHVWRSYDYPHIIMLYYHMYQIASLYPGMTHYVDKNEYLTRAMETAKAYFKYPYEILPWYETYKWGCYNELLLVDLMEALRKEGYATDADQLKQEWEKKVKYFIYDDPYPYRSEYSIDATAFESSHAFARYAVKYTMQPDTNLWYDKKYKHFYSHPHVTHQDAVNFMERQIQANIACRGWLENAYYLKGSDFRGSSDSYLLSYMAQMGGWAITDHALNFSADPNKYLSLGYASYLSSFALMNTGNAKSNYGYWYPGIKNDGASGWAYEPMRHSKNWIGKEQDRGAWFYDGEIDLGYGGALRTAATILTKDPVFGVFAYGGLVNKTNNVYNITLHDGLQQRFYSTLPNCKWNILIERDGFDGDKAIQFDDHLDKLSFRLANRTNNKHNNMITLNGLNRGVYSVYLNKIQISQLRVSGDTVTQLNLPVANSHNYLVELKQINKH